MELHPPLYIQPVSYTHLDVYKRQIKAMTQEEQIRLYRLMEKLNWFFHQEMHYLNPVSYTHLI